MAASKPTSQLSQQNHILRYTQPSLRDLSCRSGFFPSRRWTLSLSDCLPGSITQEFGVWLGEVSLFGSRTHPVLYLLRTHFPEVTFKLHQLSIEDVWNYVGLSKVEDFGDYVQIIIHGIREDDRGSN